MTQYHNPYHFVPVVADPRPDDLAVADFEDLLVNHVRHDKYVDGTYSGRLICRLKTETPIFVGANRTKDATDRTPAEVVPFLLDKKPAIPASSLRGLISSVAEAASNSALRVLENRVFSFRKGMKDASLSAIGMVISKEGDFYLRPLTLPNIELNQGRAARLSAGFSALFPVPNLKVYVGSSMSIRSASFPYETFSYDRPKYYGLKLKERSWSPNNESYKELPFDSNQYIKNGRYLLAQKPSVASDPISWDKIPDHEKSQYTRGIMRVLGCHANRDIPSPKKHEIFIPYPVEAEQWPTIPIQKSAIERFHDLADERTDEKLKGSEQLPYEPRGTKRNSDPSKKKFRLKDGDLVFFRPADNGREIEEIALSSIWRNRVESKWNGVTKAARAVNFFSEIDFELPPFDAAREKITIAEQLFGFVQDDKDEKQKSSLALAGRLYFSHAQTNAGNDCFLPPVTLRILDSPKPPSPALYFKEREGRNRYIAKRKLSLDDHSPQGRKFYLHHRQQDINAEAWQTHSNDRMKQKVKITPIKSGIEFYFHIDFDNLSERELGMLLYSLKPAPEFRHKIGMGKSLGLGAINIEPVGLFRIHRQSRYSAVGLFAPRYRECWVAANENCEEWPAIYAREHSMPTQQLALDPIQQAFRASMNADIRQALETIGNPAKIRHRVVTPLVERNGREADSEQEAFQWFVANDQGRGQQQALEPLTANSREMPALNSLPSV
jgi:CRISPR-associated protein (TIGR03986 family)